MQSTKITLKTSDQFQIIDLTGQIKEFIGTQNIKNGLITVRTLHTTTAVTINEHENGLLKDMACWLENIAPQICDYEHDDLAKRPECPPDEPKNGKAHLQAMLLGSSVTLPVIEGVLSLGTWQTVFFVELDGPRNQRTVELILH